MLLDGIDALVLARAQFAFTVSFHFIFPAISIGLGKLSRRARRSMALDRARGLPEPFQVLAQDLRDCLRAWVSCPGS